MNTQEMHQQNSKSSNFTTFSFALNKSALILCIFVIGSALTFLNQGENLVRQKKFINQKVHQYLRLLKSVNLEDQGSNFEWNTENERFSNKNYFFSSTTQQPLTTQTIPKQVLPPKQTNLRSTDLPSSISPPILPLFIETNPTPKTNPNQFPLIDALIQTTPDVLSSGQNPPTNSFDFSQQSFKPTLIGGISEQQRINWTKYSDLKNQPLSSLLAQQEKQYYENKYNTHLYDELPFCIFVPSYNNVENSRYIHNLNSILQQDYSNYYIVFIDDGSTDGTGRLVQEYAQKHRISAQKLRIFINQERKMAMPNIYRAANELCQPDDLFMIVDGDDQLLGKQVLKLFNAVFQKQKSWIVYSNFLGLEGQIGFSRPYAESAIQSNGYRQQPFFISHLRVFYTKLFSLIQESDLKDDQGNWFRAANDVAMYFPMMEMSYKRITYLPELCYLYNSNTGLNNHQVKQQEQRKNDFYIRTKSNYPILDELFSETDILNQNKKRGRQILTKDNNLPVFENVQVFGWEL